MATNNRCDRGGFASNDHVVSRQDRGESCQGFAAHIVLISPLVKNRSRRATRHLLIRSQRIRESRGRAVGGLPAPSCSQCRMSDGLTIITAEGAVDEQAPRITYRITESASASTGRYSTSSIAWFRKKVHCWATVADRSRSVGPPRVQ
jgi:hypothetical protein